MLKCAKAVWSCNPLGGEKNLRVVTAIISNHRNAFESWFYSVNLGGKQIIKRKLFNASHF